MVFRVDVKQTEQNRTEIIKEDNLGVTVGGSEAAYSAVPM